MNVVFRTDASSHIGSGHVMRCLTLGTALRERGASVSFACREHEGHLCDLIEERGFALARLPGSDVDARQEGSPRHAAWLGASWQEDAAQVRALVAGRRIDWLVVDHYALDERWERELRPYAARILVIDDLADRRHDCDVLLDQNLVPDMEVRYGDKLPKHCTALLGPDYALLQPIYAEMHDQLSPREGAIRRICISFGGADPANLTGRALAAFLGLGRANVEVDVVVGPGSPHEESIRQQVAGHANVHLHIGAPTLAPLLARADLAIGAGGGTSWERLCVGLPALVVTLADNQRPIAAALNERGLIRWLGHKDSVDKSDIAQALDELVSQGLSKDWSQRCLAVLDGKGVLRVTAVLTVTSVTPLRARPASPNDEALLLTWANDPIVRANSLSPEPILERDHQTWFIERMRNVEGCRIYIVETMDGVPIGQVRFDLRDKVWEIDYSLDCAYRGRKLGRRLLETALQAFHTEKSDVEAVGKVRVGNHSSRRVFESLGFKALVPPCGEHVEFRHVHFPERTVS